MSALDIVAPFAVGLSLAVAGLNGISAVKVLNEPPTIEGAAVYPSPVRAGEEITMPWDILKTTSCPGTLARVWSGQGDFHLSEQTRPAALPVTQSYQRFNIQTHVPDLAPAGNLRLTIQGQFQCSGQALRRFTLGPVDLLVVK